MSIFQPADPGAAFLRRQGWFALLTPGEQAEALRGCASASYARGDTIQRRRARNVDWYGVVEGRVELRPQARSGRRPAPLVVAPGDWFGEDLRLPAGHALVDAVATTPVTLAQLPLEFFRALMDGNPRFCRHYATVLWERFSQAQHATLLGAGSQAERVAAAIISHWEPPQDLPGGSWIEVNQRVLASYCGLSRQRTNCCLRDMEKDGLLQRGGRRIRILDPLRMEQLAWQSGAPPARQRAAA